MRPALRLAVALMVAGCSDHEFAPPDRAARVEESAVRYEAARFDTVAWTDAEARAAEGNRVFAEKCRRCHGTLGRGDTEYARARGLAVPSLVEADWPFAEADSVRRRIFTGHVAGMPGFGVAGITPREIDATAFYVLEVLRSDVRDPSGR